METFMVILGTAEVLKINKYDILLQKLRHLTALYIVKPDHSC